MNVTDFKSVCEGIDREISLWYDGPEPNVSQLKKGRRIAYSALIYGCIISEETGDCEKVRCCYSIRKINQNYIAYETEKGNIYLLGTPYNAYGGYFDKDFLFHCFGTESKKVFGCDFDFNYIEESIKRLRKENSFKYIFSKFYLPLLKRKKNLLFSVKNLGHHIWNEQAGLDYFISNNLIKYVDNALFYSDFLNTAKMLKKYNVLSEFVKNDNFLTGDILVTPSVHTYKRITSERLLKFCLSETTINKDDYEGKNIVVICIRNNQRCWLQEAESIPEIINNITEKGSNVQFIIDGFSSPTVNNLRTNPIDSISKDKVIYEKIYNKLSVNAKKNTSSIIGYTCVDKIAVYNYSSLLVMPYGTPEQYNWIARKSIILYGPSGARNLSKTLCDKPILYDIELDRKDIPPEFIQEVEMSNYNMDYHVIEDAIIQKLSAK